jgi:hypothetical protein
MLSSCLILVLIAVSAYPGSRSREEELEAQISSLEMEKQALEEQISVLKQIAGPLPASLDQHFPPKAPGPVFLFEKFALSGAFEGIIVDLQQNDTSGIQSNYEFFKSQYQKMSEMVPEWKERFTMEPVESLGEALTGGDPAKVGPALEEVGKVCGSCHLLFQTKAHQKYHWKDFEEIELTDPLSNETIDLHDFMERMTLAFNGIGNDLRQGQLENARKDFQAFNSRFKALAKNGCKECHQDPAGKEIPRKYYVDASVQGMIDQLGQVLSESSPDAQAIEQLSGGIGNESCMKCHLVHFPAAHTKERWEKLADVFE